ncbi:hypothetical protein A2W14_05545 [Candidatus Gottesmanbacteria bacterium RBG_16_37_8]|uniref:hydroxymethylglutaryl-CoA reductase (NADPH) n=1 Tax=Candidatus Gottesmanbacteria bacterium RBG_16_37_8 TaxID=1798371 RepID=A0A1F5YUX2_9BACT|nr:MAG: hypothetical protein A2W14_05545 [Candidatus Gottesmanbacteria bacterium RBG_16_37_8]
MSLRQLKTISERRKYLEEKLKLKLSATAIFPQGLNDAQYKNCENMIGCTQVPLGIAGPLKITGNYAKGNYYLPLSTTEGALVASVNRGCKAVTLSGGVTAFCLDVGITRGAVFKTGNIKQSVSLQKFLEENISLLKKKASSTSSHLQLIGLKIKIVGKFVFVRFNFDSQEAMGMNMATIAADKLVRIISEKTQNRCLSLAANFDIDKKPSYLNFLEGRGRQVMAEAIITESVVRQVLKTSPQKIDEVAKVKCYLGSIVAGSLGFNAHYANIIAALFISTGQDVAHVAEGSIGITSTEIVDSNLYISVSLPDLPLGTVGGGTLLPSQQESLKILKVTKGVKGEKSRALAEIIAAAVLAGELSLLSALSVGSLSESHQKFARAKIKQG